MKQYTGTKTVKAKITTRGEYVAYQGWELPAHGDPNEEIYMVEYAVEHDTKPNHPNHEGYLTMSPKTVFEKYYRENGNLTFGHAVDYGLKLGKRIARRGWNGKGMFIFMQVPAEISSDIVPHMQSLPQPIKDEFKLRQEQSSSENLKEHLSIRYKNQIAMVYPDNTIYGWVASPSDVLEEDWVILD